MINNLGSFDNYSSAYIKAITTCKHDGLRINGNLELCPMYFCLTNPRARLIFIKERNFNHEFAARFFSWMINGETDIKLLNKINPNSVKFIDKDLIKKKSDLPPNFNTAYGPRILKQLNDVIEELIENPFTRRASIIVLNEDDSILLKEKRNELTNIEYPCTISIDFQIRKRKISNNEEKFLDCYVNMRSNNLVTTICYDVYLFTMLMEFVFNKLKYGTMCNANSSLTLGYYHHYIKNAHILADECKLADKILLTQVDLGVTQIKKDKTDDSIKNKVDKKY